VNLAFIGATHGGAMDRPTRAIWTARWLLLAAGAVCAFGMLGPFRGIERAFVPWDKAAHFIAFYGLTLLMFSGFPGRRRLDLVLLATFAGAAVEVIQALTGRDGELGDLIADAAGAAAVYAPIYLERLRQPRTERRRPLTVKIPATVTETRSA
jgi:VanZ family protein